MSDQRPQYALSETHLKLTCPIGDQHTCLIWSSQKYYYYRRPIGFPLETYWRPIGDRHASLETSTCFIGDLDMLQRGNPSETDMPQYIILIYINKQKVYKTKNI